MKPENKEAMELADEVAGLDRLRYGQRCRIAAHIRRLVAENEALTEKVEATEQMFDAMKRYDVWFTWDYEEWRAEERKPYTVGRDRDTPQAAVLALVVKLENQR